MDKYINIYKSAVSTLKRHKIKVDMDQICDKFLMNVAHQDYIDHAVTLLSDDKRTFQMAQEKLEARQMALTIIERGNSRDGGTLRSTRQPRDQQYKGKDGASGNDKGTIKGKTLDLTLSMELYNALKANGLEKSFKNWQHSTYKD